MRLRPIAGAAGSEGQRCSSDLSIEPEALADFCTSKERPQMSIVDRLAPQAHFIASSRGHSNWLKTKRARIASLCKPRHPIRPVFTIINRKHGNLDALCGCFPPSNKFDRTAVATWSISDASCLYSVNAIFC